MKKRIKYINAIYNNKMETIDQFDYNNPSEKKETIRCLKEYKISDPTSYYYMSQRCTKDWNNK